MRPSPVDFPESAAIGFATSWLLNPVGGGIVYFGEAAVCPNNLGVDLLSRVLANAKPGTILGDAWRAGQSSYRGTHLTSEDPQGAPRIYLTYMHLFGDPSLRLW